MSLKRNEIRIGITISFFGKPITIKNWTELLNCFSSNGIIEAGYEPIPITDELLTTKFGFEQTVLSDAILFELDGVSIYKNEDGTYENDIDTKFEYIHQVQNFYQASTLKELTILE